MTLRARPRVRIKQINKSINQSIKCVFRFWICVEITSVGSKESKRRKFSRSGEGPISGTIFYLTSSKQSQSFWLLIGARKRWCFYDQTCRAHLASESFVFSYMLHKWSNRRLGRLFNFRVQEGAFYRYRRRLEDTPPPPFYSFKTAHDIATKVPQNNVIIISNIQA